MIKPALKLFRVIASLFTDTMDRSAAQEGGTRVYSVRDLGRSRLAMHSADEPEAFVAPSVGSKTVGWWNIFGHNVNASSMYGQPPGVIGTLTSVTQDTTNLFKSLVRSRYVSAATAASVAGLSRTLNGGLLQLVRGVAPNIGGFYFAAKFGVSDGALVNTAHMFGGLMNGQDVPISVAPSTLVNLLGIGCDSGQTTLRLYASGAVAQAPIDLGANFPVNTVNTDVYQLELFCQPGGATVAYRVTRVNTGHVAEGVLAGAQLPAAATFLGPQIWRANGATAAAVAIDIMKVYWETPY